MAYNEALSEQIAGILLDKGIIFEEKKMFGGICFMLNEKMCVGVVKDELMLRVLDERFEEAIGREFARPMDFTGKRMKGFLFVAEEGLSSLEHLEKWVEMGMEFGELGVVKSKTKKK